MHEEQHCFVNRPANGGAQHFARESKRNAVQKSDKTATLEMLVHEWRAVDASVATHSPNNSDGAPERMISVFSADLQFRLRQRGSATRDVIQM